jgi:5'-nucleotidase
MSLIEKTALLDLDGTVADYSWQLAKDLAELASPGEPMFDFHTDDAPDWFLKRIDLIRAQPGWWRKLPKLQAGFDILNAVLRIGYQVHVLTKGPRRAPNAWSEKMEWCKTNLPSNIGITVTLGRPAEGDVPCGPSKGAMYGRVLIDDYPQYATEWLSFRPRGLVVMPKAIANEGFSHPQAVIYDGKNLAYVEELLQLAFDREPSQPFLKNTA